MAGYIIVGIHGLKNKPRRKNLEKLWSRAIQDGLQRNEGRTSDERPAFSMVRWAQLMYPAPLDDRRYPDGGPETGPYPAYDDNFWDKTRAGLSDLFDDPIDAMKRWIGIDDVVVDGLLKVFFNDLKTYYQDKDMRNKVRGLLRDELAKHWQEERRILLIAHSMGSIIAYDTLRLIGREQRGNVVDHFVTIGSPLGMPHVKAKIAEEFDLMRTPSIVTRWTNMSERRDPVALDTHLAGDYKANDYGVRVEDDLVANETVREDDKSGRTDFHSSVGYLRTPEMSHLIRGFI